jgi:YidC/Oxa1 family membrane protein insertase
MIWFHGVFHSYGIAIILVSILTKVIFYPLTQKSFKSMQQMQALQPLLTKLKEQYKDNPKKMQQETMALYKKHKVNPLGGCLPLLFQMPIFFALFRMLSGAVELRGADFLWIKDLTMPDTLFVLGNFNINILPLIMGGCMFLQQKMTPTTDPNQKKMVVFMPLIFTVIFYNMPSGLVLYWLVNNVLTIGQQYLIKKQGVSVILEEENSKKP